VPAVEGGCGYDGGRRADYVHARSQDMLAAGRVAAAGSALAAHGVDLSDTASLQLALHGAGIHSLHALDDVAQVATTVSVVTTPPIGKRSIVMCVCVCVCVCLSIRRHVFRTSRPIFTVFVHVTYDRGSVPL